MISSRNCVQWTLHHVCRVLLTLITPHAAQGTRLISTKVIYLGSIRIKQIEKTVAEVIAHCFVILYTKVIIPSF